MKETELAEKMHKIKSWLGTGSINIFGRPFAGKDTHGKKLADILGATLIGGGDIIRSNKEHAHIKEHISTGALAPTEEYLRIVLPYFEMEEFDGRPLVLSSVGRWHGEETGVLEATSASGHPLRAVIYLKITKEEMWKRWEKAQEIKDRGERHDDAEHALQKRIEEYDSKTMPVIDFYRGRGMLIEIDGSRNKQEVFAGIIDRLYAMSSAT